MLKACVKVGVPWTEDDLRKFFIDLGVWKELLNGVIANFCKELVISPLLVMSTGMQASWTNSNELLRELLETEIRKANIPSK